MKVTGTKNQVIITKIAQINSVLFQNNTILNYIYETNKFIDAVPSQETELQNVLKTTYLIYGTH